MNDSSDIIKFIIIAIVVFLLGYFLIFLFMPQKPVVKKYSGIKLNETKDEVEKDDDSIFVIDNINFNLDTYEPKNELEAMLVDSMKEGRQIKAAGIRLNKSMDNLRNDSRFLGKYFKRAEFYYDKGEYGKAIRILVKLLKQNIKSPITRSNAYKLLSDCYAELGIDKQYYKALWRYYGVELEMAVTKEQKKKLKIMMLKMKQRMELSK